MGKEKLSDLEKARNHFIKAATECAIGAAFALKGLSGLLGESEGRKTFADLAAKFVGKGIGLAANLSDFLKSSEGGERRKPQKTGSRKKRTRKAGVE